MIQTTSLSLLITFLGIMRFGHTGELGPECEHSMIPRIVGCSDRRTTILPVTDKAVVQPGDLGQGTTSRGNVCQYVFDTPAFFPRTGYDSQGHAIVFDGLVIYEGMKLTWNERGEYTVRFTAERPTVPTTLRLQFLVWNRESRVWQTVTVPPIKIEPRGEDNSATVDIVVPTDRQDTAVGTSNGKLLSIRASCPTKDVAIAAPNGSIIPNMSISWKESHLSLDLSLPFLSSASTRQQAISHRLWSPVLAATSCKKSCTSKPCEPCIRRTGTARFGYGRAALK